MKTLERRSYGTYLNRLVAQERLAARNNAWNFAMVSTATATTVASVGLLSDEAMYGSRGSTLLAALAVIALAASIAVSSMNYGARSRAMEANYKRIQQISVEAENFFVHAETATPAHYASLAQEYGVAVEGSENHTVGDYARVALREARRKRAEIDPAVKDTTVKKELERLQRAAESLRWPRRRDGVITSAPYAALIVPLAIMLPFLQWTLCG